MDISSAILWDSDSGAAYRYAIRLRELAGGVAANLPESSARLALELKSLVDELLASARVGYERATAYRQLFETFEGGFWQIDKDGHNTAVSSRMAEMLGYEVGEMLGQHLFEYMRPEMVPACQSLLERRERGVREHHDFQFLKKNGETMYARLCTAPQFSEAGEFQGVVAIVFDLSAQRRFEHSLQETERRFRTLADSAFEGVCISRSGIVRDCNEQFAKMLKYSRQALIGLPLVELLPVEVQTRVMGNILEGRDSFVEHEMVRSDGSRCLVEARGRTLFDGADQLRITVLRDITERKRVEQQLRDSELRLSQALLVGKSFTFEWTTASDTVVRSSGCSQVLGLADGIEPGPSWDGYMAWIHPDDAGRFASTVRSLTPENPKYEIEYRLVRPDRQIVHIQESALGFFDGDQLARLLGIAANISEKKANELAMERSEERLRLALLSTGDSLWDWDLTTNHHSRSDRWAEMRGLRPEEVTDDQSAWTSRIHPEDIESTLQAFEEHLAGRTARYSHEHRVVRRDGSCLWVLDRGMAQRDSGGRATRILGVETDIDDRKRIEARLKESEARLHFALGASDTGAWEWNESTDVVMWTGCCHAILRGSTDTSWTMEQLMGLVVSEDRERVNREFADAMDGRLDLNLACRIRDEQGEIRWIWMAGRRVPDAASQPRRMVGIIQDVTSRKQAEQRLLETNQRLTAVMDSVPVGIVLAHDPECRNVSGNRVALEQIGVPGDQNIAASACRHPSDAYRLRFFRDGKELLPSELPLEVSVKSGESIAATQIEIERPDGTRIPMEVTAAPIRDSKGAVVGGIAVTVDITDRMKNESQLKSLNETLEQRVAERTAESRWRASQLQRLTARMTQVEERERRRLALVLHDGLQQSLAAAAMRVEMVRRKQVRESVGSLLAEALSLINQAIDESRSLTSELSPPVLYEAGLSAGLRWLSRDISQKYSIPVEVDIQQDLDPEDLTTKVFVFQAVRELLLNAVKHAKSTQIRVVMRCNVSHRLEVEVSDNGAGFSIPARGEEFSSQGFGLFSIRERLTLIGGQLILKSTPGEGTTATVQVPFIDKQQKRDVLEPIVTTRASGLSVGRSGRVRLVLVDDHPLVRSGLAEMLMEHPDLNIVGEAGDGRQAVQKALELKPDIVLMDVSMPNLDGVEATRQIKSLAPEVAVIGYSMHDSEDMADRMKEAGASDYLPKPTVIDSLIQSIFRLAIDRRSGELVSGELGSKGE